jgi:RNA polymerase sigma factor (sigma-70 family)
MRVTIAGMVDEFAGLLQSARHGSEVAWIALYRDLAPGVIAYLRAQRAPDPEDLAGEVFLEVVRDLHRFEGNRGQFRSWVFSIAHLRLLDTRRRAARRPVDPTPLEALVDKGAVGDSEQEALTRIGTGAAVMLLDLLLPDQRDVLLLRIVCDLSVEQVAGVLDKRPGTVRVLQHRGLAKLRREMSSRGVTR